METVWGPWHWAARRPRWNGYNRVKIAYCVPLRLRVSSVCKSRVYIVSIAYAIKVNS